MYLEKITLQRFRSCEDLVVNFRPDLTVLVGENNGGKSTIIDSLRLLTLPLNGRKDRYPEADDLKRGSASSSFTIQGHFTGLSDTLKGLLISAVPDPTKDQALLGIKHETIVPHSSRGKTTYWAGNYDTSEPEAGAAGLIRHVYLPALRDAQYALGSGSPTKISSLLAHFLLDGEEQTFLDAVRRTGSEPRVLTAVNAEIGTALGNLTGGVRRQEATLAFTDETVLDISRDLRFRLSDAGFSPTDIRFSGLGYANLLYMATVVVELAKAKEADLTLFLVEEPEAHLHPQLQMLVLQFLLDKAKGSIAQHAVPGQAEGKIQIVVTSHSPNLTAWVSPNHLVVVRSVQQGSTTQPQFKAAAVSIAELAIGTMQLGKINRYLDVTRSAMLFGNRALLVEGIAESILLPIIAKHFVLHTDEAAWRRFQGTALVAIDGVDFEPYIEILLKTQGAACIADNVVVVTDGDPGAPGNRKDRLEQLAAGFSSPGRLQVFCNEHTLEHSLFAAGNEKLFKYAFLSLHPRSKADWDTRIDAIAAADRPAALLQLLTDKKTRKGDLAQAMAARLVKRINFHVPTYLQQAIQVISCV